MQIIQIPGDSKLFSTGLYIYMGENKSRSHYLPISIYINHRLDKFRLYGNTEMQMV
ncbi:hypothetical protein [Rivularia sp. UHCC 0363]|uniref:hypothetical protein n=1 Tax=Rivularia sp. UHCC 0363 TaxID=3110244 RepID=UPI002B200772|nr:hypothetical protein [Rivularia sp. UHCC 0363]MEA5598591.1 hypothetical protein [Rivularia sp. UHCC 0363]